MVSDGEISNIRETTQRVDALRTVVAALHHAATEGASVNEQVGACDQIVAVLAVRFASVSFSCIPVARWNINSNTMKYTMFDKNFETRCLVLREKVIGKTTLCALVCPDEPFVSHQLPQYGVAINTGERL